MIECVIIKKVKREYVTRSDRRILITNKIILEMHNTYTELCKPGTLTSTASVSAVQGITFRLLRVLRIAEQITWHRTQCIVMW